MPAPLRDAVKRAEEFARAAAGSGTLFEEMGFYYIGPLDGHNLDHLLPVLRNVRDNDYGPVLIHVITKKGKGYLPAESSADKMHGVVKFDVVTGAQVKAKAAAPAYTKVFAQGLIAEAKAPTSGSSRLRRRCRAARGSICSGMNFRSGCSMSASRSSMR